MEKDKQVNKGNIEIDKTLSVFNVAEVHKKIIDACSRFNSIEIDLKDITDCDTAGIQLLYSLKKSCMDEDKELSLVNPSRAVTDALDRMSVSLDHLFID